MPTSHSGTRGARAEGNRMGWPDGRWRQRRRMHAHQPTAAGGSPTPSAGPSLGTRLWIMNREEGPAAMRGPCPLLLGLTCRPKLLPCGRRATRGRHHRHRDRGGQRPHRQWDFGASTQIRLRPGALSARGVGRRRGHCGRGPSDQSVVHRRRAGSTAVGRSRRGCSHRVHRSIHRRGAGPPTRRRASSTRDSPKWPVTWWKSWAGTTTSGVTPTASPTSRAWSHRPSELYAHSHAVRTPPPPRRSTNRRPTPMPRVGFLWGRCQCWCHQHLSRIRRSVRVIWRRFASSDSAFSAGQNDFYGGFDSRQLYPEITVPAGPRCRRLFSVVSPKIRAAPAVGVGSVRQASGDAVVARRRAGPRPTPRAPAPRRRTSPSPRAWCVLAAVSARPVVDVGVRWARRDCPSFKRKVPAGTAVAWAIYGSWTARCRGSRACCARGERGRGRTPQSRQDG